VLRLLNISVALACMACVDIAAAQAVPATGPVSVEGSTPIAEAPPVAAAPSDGCTAADDPVAAMRSAVDHAKTLAAQRNFKAGLQRQRDQSNVVDEGALTPPQFDLRSPQPLGRAAMADALSPPTQPWSQTNRQPLLILVSFAMPDSELQELATQGARIGAPLVLRGLVDDSFPETQKRLMGFRTIHGASFRVDPTVFSRFSVSEVPTFVLPLEPLQTCSMTSCPAPAHVRLTGDAGLDYVLDEIDRRSQDLRARTLAQQLRAQLSADPPQ
jgi:type-F conjugative transfer system pilin assembly protein TrbC